MPSIAIVSGVLYALFDGSDRHHRRAVDFLAGARVSLVANLAVITEVTYLLRFSLEAQTAHLAFVEAGIEVDQQTIQDIPRIVEVMKKYAGLPADFADASLVALCERRGLEQIATLDRDFDIYQLSNGTRLRNAFSVD